MKSKFGLILVVILAVFLLAACEKGETPENPPETTGSVSQVDEGQINKELRDVYSFCKTEEGLVALKKDGGQVLIYAHPQDSYGSYEFSVGSDKVYIWTSADNYLNLIDLTKGDGMYEPVKRIAYDFLYKHDFTAIDNVIYFSDFSNGSGIYSYDIESNETELLIETDEKRYTIKHHSEEKLLFYYNGQDSDIYMYDIQINQYTKIADGGTIEFVYGDKMIYSSDEQELTAYYEYDINTGTSKKITSASVGSSSVRSTSIVPYGGGYVYSDDNEIYKIDSNSDKELVYSFNDHADGYYIGGLMDLITSDKIILITEGMDDTLSLILDIENKTVEESSIYNFGYAQYVSFE